MTRVYILLASLPGLLAPLAAAHELNIAQFTFVQQEQGNHFLLRVENLPQSLVPDQPVRLPASCELISRRESPPGNLPSVEIKFRCGEEPSGALSTQWGSDGGVVVLRNLKGRETSRMLRGSRSGMSLSLPDWQSDAALQRSTTEIAWLYLLLGSEHVLIGLDHLGFVLCLTLLAKGRILLYLITAFTLGHSLSLALAYLGVINISIAPVEAVIALSIVYMAREAVLHQRARLNQIAVRQSLHSVPVQLAVTTGFGLIHGLGFASVLGDLGVNPGESTLALIFFNLGVEVGQILFVCVVLLLLLVSRFARFDKLMAQAALNLVGAMGLFWTLQRVASL